MNCSLGEPGSRELVVEEHRARDVDEGRAAVGQRLETKIEHRAGQDGRAGHVPSTVQAVSRTLPR